MNFTKLSKLATIYFCWLIGLPGPAAVKTYFNGKTFNRKREESPSIMILSIAKSFIMICSLDIMQLCQGWAENLIKGIVVFAILRRIVSKALIKFNCS